jgi:hypothetical protein
MEYRISKKRIKMRDLLGMNSGDPAAQMKVMAACMIDTRTGEFIDKDLALEMLMDIDAEQNDAEVAKFSKALVEAEQAAVPLASTGR